MKLNEKQQLEDAMGEVKKLESEMYTLEKIKQMKGDKKLLVVFSTFGEREADLIYEKINLLRDEIGIIIDKIILSHRRAGDTRERTEAQALKADPNTLIIICNDLDVPDMGREKGKGSDMRRTLYMINKEYSDKNQKSNIIIVFLDADVLKEFFGSHFVLGLAGAVLEGSDFAKASFWREMGRVKKYVAQPLFSVIEHEKLEKLREFAYPLSGEVSGTLDFFNSVNFWQIYGVETGINIDACMGRFSIADVNLGLYDHEHHGDLGIQKMSFGIIRTYLLQLQHYGILELKDNARISNDFKASVIDEKGNRDSIEFDLTERKYQPLKNIV